LVPGPDDSDRGATWPTVKALIQRDKEGFRRLQRMAQGLPSDAAVRDWGSELMPAALVYRAENDPTLLAKIRKLLRATIDHYLLLHDFNSHVETRVGCAAALDWVWNDLPPAEREGLAYDLLRYAYGRHVQDVLQGPGRAEHDPYYYSANMHWYVGLAVWHPCMTGTDYLRTLAVLGRGYDNNVVSSFGQRLELMKDRGGVTRVEYNFQDLPTPAWTFLHCWQSAVGPTPTAWDFASGLAPSYVLRRVLGFKPGFYRHFGHAHSWRKSGGWQSEYRLYDNLGQFIYFFSKSQPEEAAIAAYLRQRMEQAGCVGPGSYPIYPYVLNLAGAPAPKLPDGLPVARHYATNGLVLMSLGFDPGATRVLYSCGGGQGEHLDTGHFTIFKKGYLALDSGTRALDEWADPSSGENYDKQSVAHNTVLIRMPGETMKGLTHPTLELQANSGGQRRLPTFARVLAFQSDHLFAYAATDATPTYHPDKCAQMVRQFLFLTPDYFVVCDRVAAKSADYPKTWLLHTANEPVIAGNEFRADHEQGRIFCRTLYPADAVLEKIGGPGKEFWADGRNWPIPAHSPYFRQLGIKDAADVAENMGRWRVEVKPGAPRTDDVFLHLIQASDPTAAKMVESRVHDTGDQIELTFTAGVRTYTIAWNKAGPVGGHIRIADAGKVLVDKDLTREIQPQPAR
jgi:heparin/heparan-sulfate lyase